MKKVKVDMKFSLILLVLLLLFLASCFYRKPFDSEGFYMSDATYHVLLTMQAYDDSDFLVHSLLPIQTYGAENNKFINNGPSLIQDADGNSFYVSFSPIGFYAPYVFCKLLHLPLSVNSIYIFNCLLMLMSAILCAGLVYVAFKKRGLSIVAFVAYIFIPEVLYTQGIVYWHHSLSQVLLLLQLFAFSKLSFGYPKHKLPWQVLFIVASFVYPYVEWTGFVSNIGFALCVFINGFSLERTNNNRMRLAYNHVASSKVIILGATTIASFCYYLWRFSKIAPISEIISTLLQRESARSVGSYFILLKGYFASYKPWLILTGICVALALIVKSSRNKMGELLANKKIIVLLVATFFPLLENVVMTEHAIEYTFDRLKFAPLLILILVIAINALLIADRRMILQIVCVGGGDCCFSVRT